MERKAGSLDGFSSAGSADSVPSGLMLMRTRGFSASALARPVGGLQQVVICSLSSEPSWSRWLGDSFAPVAVAVPSAAVLFTVGAVEGADWGFSRLVSIFSMAAGSNLL